MTHHDRDTLMIGRVLFRQDNTPFGIMQADRLSHVYVLGKTGTGKSTLLESMATQDLNNNRGLALIDPHGDLVSRVYAQVPQRRRGTAIYLDAAAADQPYRYNPLRHVRPDRIALAASGFLEVLKKTWSDAWGVRMEHILRNALFALLEMPNSTIADIPILLTEKSFRREVAKSISNEPVARFWDKEFDRMSLAYRADGAAAVLNKVGAFLADERVRYLLCDAPQEISPRRIMDESGVLLVNLGKGRLGEDSSSLLGGLLMTTLGLAGFSRADMPPEQRSPFFVYADEFQSFTTLAMANMLSELRKYGVGLTIAHQYLAQLEPEIRHAVLGNAGTLIAFRVGAEDAPYIARELREDVGAGDLLSLPNYQVYVRLMIGGVPSRTFSAAAFAPAWNSHRDPAVNDR